MNSTLTTAPNTHRRESVSVGKASGFTGPEGTQTEGIQETDAQEDWLSVATADPASWLKEVDH